MSASQLLAELRRRIALCSYWQPLCVTDVADDDGDDPFEAQHVFAPRNSSVFTVKPKNDNHGLGFDPLSNAPEFAKLRDARPSSSIVPEARIMTVGRALASGDVGGGFR